MNNVPIYNPKRDIRALAEKIEKLTEELDNVNKRVAKLEKYAHPNKPVVTEE